MTVIAWDGKTLAADRRCVNFGHPFATTKIFKIDGALAGAVGDSSWCAAAIGWLRDGRDAAKFPKRPEGDQSAMLVIERDGTIHVFESSEWPRRVEESFHAMGSGRDYALCAMYLGRTAELGCDIACQLDTSCGNGIDVLTLDE